MGLLGWMTGRSKRSIPSRMKERRAGTDATIEGILRAMVPKAEDEDHSGWTDTTDYANAMTALVGQPIQRETTGLERNEEYVRALGEEINEKFGFEGMQEVWHAIHAMKGPQATSDLTRIWDGVGRWQK